MTFFNCLYHFHLGCNITVWYREVRSAGAYTAASCCDIGTPGECPSPSAIWSGCQQWKSWILVRYAQFRKTLTSSPYCTILLLVWKRLSQTGSMFSFVFTRLDGHLTIITQNHWIQIDHLLLYMFMIDSWWTVYCATLVDLACVALADTLRCINNCAIIFIHWIFNFVYFVGRWIHKFKIPTKCLFNLIAVCFFWKSMNSSVLEHVHYNQTTNFMPVKYNNFILISLRVNYF